MLRFFILEEYYSSLIFFIVHDSLNLFRDTKIFHGTNCHDE